MQEDNKRAFDKRRGEMILQPGAKVWLATMNLKLTCPSKKLAPKFVGPFPIRGKVNNVSYELSLPESFRIHPVFHMSLLKPTVTDYFLDRESRPLEPVIIDEHEEVEVEVIVDCRKIRSQVQNLIKWKGYGPEKNSREPEHNVHAVNLVHAFFRNYLQKKNQLGSWRLAIRRGQCQERLRHSADAVSRSTCMRMHRPRTGRADVHTRAHVRSQMCICKSAPVTNDGAKRPI